MFIVEFLEYNVTGIWHFLWVAFMVICGLACVGVVGEKESKKKQAKLLARREEAAKEEYKKAQELIDKQAHSYSVDRTLDPTAKAEEAAVEQAPVVDEVALVEQAPVSEVVVLDAAPTENNATVVDNVTPIVDNTSEEAIKENDVPAVLVINDDGTSNS